MTARRIVADGICGNPHSVHLRYEVGHDDRVRLVYFDDKRTSISNVIVIFPVFSVIFRIFKQVSCKYQN